MENIENSKMKDKKTYERVFPYVWFIEDVSKEINQTQEKKWIQILREAGSSQERKKEKINFLCRTSGDI